MISYKANEFIEMKISRMLSRRGFPMRMNTPESLFDRIVKKVEQRMFACIELQVELSHSWNRDWVSDCRGDWVRSE